MSRRGEAQQEEALGMRSGKRRSVIALALICSAASVQGQETCGTVIELRSTRMALTQLMTRRCLRR